LEDASQVNQAQRQLQYRSFLKAAKECLNHPDADLELLIDTNDSSSILNYIVSEEIEVLIQHPKVVEVQCNK
jgi:hypothetical protein